MRRLMDKEQILDDLRRLTELIKVGQENFTPEQEKEFKSIYIRAIIREAMRVK